MEKTLRMLLVIIAVFCVAIPQGYAQDVSSDVAIVGEEAVVAEISEVADIAEDAVESEADVSGLEIPEEVIEDPAAEVVDDVLAIAEVVETVQMIEESGK